MLTLAIIVPREIDPAALNLPANAHPFGATPHWAPKEFRVECLSREEADLLSNSLNATPGVTAHILGDPVKCP